MIRWSRDLINDLTMLTDIIVLIVASLIDYSLRAEFGGPETVGQRIVLCGVGAFFFVNVARLFQGYDRETYRHVSAQVITIAPALLVACVGMWILAWTFAPQGGTTPRWMIDWVSTAIAALLVGRLAMAMLIKQVERQGLLRRRVVIIGAGDIGEEVAQHLNDPVYRDHYELVAVYDERSRRHDITLGGFEVRPDVENLHYLASERGVDIIVIATPWQAVDRILSLIERFQMIAADIVVPLQHNRLNLRLPETADLAGMAVMPLMRRPMTATHTVVKAVEDYVVATIGLILVAPVLVIAAIAIKLDSPGPVLFKQPRRGLNNAIFPMFKLRTMTVDPTDDGSKGTSRDDPRITRVGRFLRRTSIDELPQLLNVLRGEMSVVGPRAHVPNMLVADQAYIEAVKQYATRHRIKPGITGWAQINGMRGGITSLEKAERGVDLDVYYIKNWSLWFDIVIMIRTVLIGMVGRNVF